MTYTVYEFFTRDEIERDWLVSILSDLDFDGFEETSESIKAYVPTDKIDHKKITEYLAANELSHIEISTAPLPNKNWNEEWEKNFEPIVIANRVAIRAPFHAPMAAEYELVIEPKMSFGTGHHGTTAAVIELMLGIDFNGKDVLDFGSGTGVLAILAEKLKAAKIIAIDNEEWAYNNCVENTARNGCVNITSIQGDDKYVFTQKFDIILANINRNVILANISNWNKLLNDKAILIVSGILLGDEAAIVNAAKGTGLVVKSRLENNGWLALALQHH